MRIVIRTSKLAVWSRRLGSFAIPLAVIPIFMHRAGTINSETFILILMLALGFSLGAVLLGAGAFIRIWITGDVGWGRAAAGLFLGAICLVPMGFFALRAQDFSTLSDVTTNPERRLALFSPILPPDAATPMTQAELVEIFPNLVMRTYPMRANQTYLIVEALVEEQGWQIVDRSPPNLELAAGQINALDMTFLGWRDEIAVRVEGRGDGATVMVRSASLGTRSDFGRNGQRIEDFLLELDSAVSRRLRNQIGPSGAPVPAVQ